MNAENSGNGIAFTSANECPPLVLDEDDEDCAPLSDFAPASAIGVSPSVSAAVAALFSSILASLPSPASALDDCDLVLPMPSACSRSLSSATRMRNGDRP